jgi:hypothetical protein
LVDEAVLPGETHRLDANWDEEMAVLAGLSGSDGRIVLLPRAVHHSDHRPMIGILAVVDAVRSDDLGQIRGARLFRMRRVEIGSLSSRKALLVAEVVEVDEGDATDADWGRLLRVARQAARREGVWSPPGLPPDLDDKSPGQFADVLALELGANDEARLALLRATR